MHLVDCKGYQPYVDMVTGMYQFVSCMYFFTVSFKPLLKLPQV